MGLTDTHIHLYAEEFNNDREELMRAAADAGVQRFLLPNIDATSVDDLYSLCNSWPGTCFPMMGLHPCYIKEDYHEQLETIHKSLQLHRDAIIAVGEIGLDFYWDVTFRKEQEEAFRIQSQWAEAMNLPISIHSRNSTTELIQILHELNLPRLRGVFHCFSGDINQADEVMNMGFFLGIGGVVTFKNSGLEKIVSDIPLEFLVLETDGPYLAPTPFRGKRNKPEYLKLIAHKVAEIKGVTYEEVARLTTENANRLFKLGT